MKIFTIGYGGRKVPKDFAELLAGHGVQLVCDIRFAPQRAFMGIYTYNPQKGDGPIMRLLSEYDISYQWLKELGNPDRNDPKMTKFRQLMQTAGERRIQRLQSIAREKVVCLLCAEKDYNRCHRKIVTKLLERKGWEIIHLS